MISYQDLSVLTLYSNQCDCISFAASLHISFQDMSTTLPMSDERRELLAAETQAQKSDKCPLNDFQQRIFHSMIVELRK